MRKTSVVFCLLLISCTSFALHDGTASRQINAVVKEVGASSRFQAYHHLSKVRVLDNRENLKLRDIVAAELIDGNGQCDAFYFNITTDEVTKELVATLASDVKPCN